MENRRPYFGKILYLLFGEELGIVPELGQGGAHRART